VFKSIKTRFVAAAAAAVSALAIAGAVVAMTVQPVVVDLTTSGRGMSQALTVENTFTNPLAVEMRVEDLNLTTTGVESANKDSGDLLVFPPQTLIQPGQTQSFRVQYVGDPRLARSKHYYVTVAQLPVQLPEGQSAIQILYNFKVLVSISPDSAKPALKVDSARVGKNAAGKPVPSITVSNTSNAHGYLSKGRLRLIVKNSADREVLRRTLSGPEIQQTIGFGLIGAGQTRQIMVPVEIPVEGTSVDAQFTPDNSR
jgi:fimbrial chaperone protein